MPNLSLSLDIKNIQIVVKSPLLDATQSKNQRIMIHDSCFQTNVQKEVQLQIKPFTRVHIIQIKVLNSHLFTVFYAKIFVS